MTLNPEIERHLREFPGMPAFSQDLVVYLQDPEADFARVTEMIQYDPGLTANILKMANSVAYGGVRKVDSLRAALPRLGVNRVLEMVLALTVSTRLVTDLPGMGLGDDLLRHSIFTAVAAGELARLLGMRHTEMAFTIGLMHDLGMVVLDPFVARHKARFDDLFQASDCSFEQVEQEVLGIDHAEAGARILADWRLSDAVVTAVRWHHEPERVEAHRELVDLIHLADILAFSQGIGTGDYGMGFRASSDAISALGLRQKQVEYVASETVDKMRELAGILGLRP